MKRTNRKFLLLVVSFLLTAMVFITMPVASMAKDTYVPTEGLNVSASAPVIDVADGNLDYRPTYEMTFKADNAAFSSYEMSFRMPYFVNVESVLETPLMNGMDNSVFTYYVTADGIVNVAYSCANNVRNAEIFTVYFTVNDYYENSGSIDFLDAHFVDIDVNDVPVSFTYSPIEITSKTVMGDFDNDGVVTLADLLLIQQSMVNPYHELSERQFRVSDIDKDGEITIRDCQYIQNYLVGRIGSLDNIIDAPNAPYTYLVEVVITNELGEELVRVSNTAQQGLSYTDVTAFAMRQLYKNYDVHKFLRAYSDYYGIIDLEVSGDVYTVQANDCVTLAVEATPKQQSTKFAYSTTYINEDGSYTVVDCYFYYDNTALFTMRRVLDGVIMESEEQRTDWYLEGSYLVVVIPDMGSQIMFVVGEDGCTLYPYEGGGNEDPKPECAHRDVNDDYYCDYCGEWWEDGCDNHHDKNGDSYCDKCGVYLGGYSCNHRDKDDNYICDYCGINWDDGQDVWEEKDYVESVSHNITIGIIVGSDPSVLIEEACQHYVTVHYSVSGEQHVYLTPDMLDYSGVDFNTVGEYRVNVILKMMDGLYHVGFDVYVMPDKSEVGVLGVYNFNEEISEMIDISTITVYADGTVMLDEFYVTPYEMIADGIIAFSIEGGDLVVDIRAEGNEANFYIPSEEEYIGKYTYNYEYGPTLSFSVYGNYTGAGYYVALYEMSYYDEYHGEHYYVFVTTRVFLDLESGVLEHGSMPCDMIIADGDMLVANHDIVVRTEAPGCDWYGYEIHYCSKCGDQVSRVEIAPLGHTYDDEGYCVNCGHSNKVDEEFEYHKEEILCKMDEEWSYLNERYGADVTKFEPRYIEIRESIIVATEHHIIDEYYNSFMMLVDKIHNNLGGEIEVHPVGWWLMNPIPATVTQGEDINAFIEQYIINNILVIDLSNGQTVYVTVDHSMITGYGDFYSVGWTYVRIYCATGNFGIEYNVQINILPDLSNEEIVGEFYFNDTAGTGWGYITVYANGMLVTDGEIYYYDWYRDDVIAMDMDGAPIYLALNYGNMSMEFYKPEGPIIGVYTMYMGDNQLIFTVYGEYYGADTYIAEITARYGDGEGGIKQEMTVATAVELDLEACTLYHGGYGIMFIDENGYLNFGDVPEPDQPSEPEVDFEYYRDQVKDQMKILWSEVEMSGVLITDEQYQRYHQIMEHVYVVSEMWQLHDLYLELEELCNAIMGIVEVRYTDIIGIPHRIIAGTTMEEFCEMLNNARIVVGYTDGSEVEYYLDAGMFEIGELDLDNIGEYHIYWSIHVENIEYPMEGSTWVEVIENLGEGDSVEYDFISHIEGAENVMEWTAITLYENGYALLHEEYGFEFVPYTTLNGIIICNCYGIDVLLELVLDSNGVAMGITYLRPETDQIYVYDDGDMYIILEVFSFDGKWYAFFDAGEYNYDGSVDRMEVTGPIIFNADGNKIYSELVEDWFMIVDGNRLEFTECDHVFADDARCIYCGYREGGYTDKECDHVFDEKGCCVYCGMFVNVGTTCNHVDNDINYICDMCGLVIGEVAVCNHVLDASGCCIYCGIIFEYVVTYQHIDNNLDGMCDNCGLMMNDYSYDAGVDLPEYEYTYGTGNNDYATITP